MKLGAGQLRDYVTVNRPSKVKNGRGGMVDGVIALGTIAASIRVKKGGEEVQARRLAGTTEYEIWVRFDAISGAILTSDYLTDATGINYSIKWAGSLDEGRKRWVLIMAESGKATKR